MTLGTTLGMPNAFADPALVLLAAGMGSRFGGLKQLAPVGPAGEAILDYTVTDALAAGIDRVVLVVRSEIREAIADHVRRRWPASVSVDWVLQDEAAGPHGRGRAKPLGTAQAVLATQRAVEGPFLVLNADDHYGAPALGLVAGHLAAGREHALAGFPVAHTLLGPRPVNRGRVWAGEDGLLDEVVEGQVDRSDGGVLTWSGAGTVEHLEGHELVSMNLWGFQPSVFRWLQQEWDDFIGAGLAATGAELLLPSVVHHMVAGGEQVRLLPTDEWCLGVTHADDLPLIQAIALRGWRPT